jgi:plastocyanin
VLAASVAVALGVVACNSSNNPTAPYGGGGGGGGGGTSFNLGPFAIGQSAQLVFANAGTFGYHCNVHRNMGMVGAVQVDASGADSALVQIAASGFSFTPSTAHIKPGGYVRWVNASTLTNHTVTSN